MTPSVAVAVVSWNTRELLRRCLLSLAPDVASGRAEVWVIDNGSNDGSAAMVEREFEWVSLIASEENLGFGRAVNEIAGRTSAPWLAPANADVALAPGALAALIEVGEAEPRVAIVAPRLVQPNGKAQHSVHAFPTVMLSSLFALGVHRVLPGVGRRLCIEGYWNPDEPRAVDWAHGAFLLVRRSAFEAVGGFDRAQWMYAEDLDLAWRCAEAKWIVRYEPAATVAHEVSAATRQAFGEARVERYMAATYGWMARRRGLAVTWAFALVNTAGAGARALGFSVLTRLRFRRFAQPRDVAGAYVRIHARGLRSRNRLIDAASRQGAG